VEALTAPGRRYHVRMTRSSPSGGALSGARIVVFDTETTGLSPVRDHVVEIAAIALEGGTETGRFEELIDPGVPMPPEVTALHGIDDGMVRGKPRFAEVAARFMDFAGDAILAAHNAPYDIAMILGPGLAQGLSPAGNPVIDTCRLSRRLIDAPNYRLGTIAAKLGIDITRAHRAMPDTEATTAVLVECLKRMGASATMADVERVSSAKIRFGSGSASGWRIPDRLAAITEALERGSSAKIVYSGGSHGDAPRTITPLFFLEIAGHLNVAALCHLDASLKNFRMAQIREARHASA
jgi:DNA polymerase III epsilon subunit family exonuclease